MNNFQKVKIAELGKIITGKTPKTSDKNNFGGNTFFLTPSDNMNGKYIYKTKRYVSDKGKSTLKNIILPKDSICVSCIGSDLGKVVLTTGETITNQQINSIIVDSSKFDVNYIYYSATILGKILNYHSKTSTAVPIINKTKFSNYTISCPNLPTQKKIASILSALDDKIELNNKINKNLEEMAQAIFKSWFVDFEPWGGEMPDDWEYGKLKDILSLSKNSINKNNKQNLPYLPIELIPKNSLVIKDFKPTEEAKSGLIKFDSNDIIIGAMRVYFHRVIIAPCPGITRTTCFVLTPVNADYLNYSLMVCNQKESINFAQATSKGSTMPYAIWEGGLGELNINIPSIEIMKKFNKLIKPIVTKLQNSYFENKNLVKLRDTLLPKLMSGELDVSNLEI